MRRALLIVDVQWDFIDGTLGGPGRYEVVTPLLRLAEQAAEFVAASLDWHPPNHCSFAVEPKFEDGSWPVHCVRFTRGAALPDPIARVAEAYFLKGTHSQYEAYSAFQGVDRIGPLVPLEGILDHVDELRIGGLVTEKCVRASVLDALRLLPNTKIIVVEEACAGLTAAGHRETLQELQAAGAVIE